MQIPTSVRELLTKNVVVQVATSNDKGTPHIAAAKGMRIIGDEIVAFEDWLCLQTLRNIENNPKVAISLMEPGGESGYQLIGTIVKSVSTEMLDGYLPSEKHSRIPQSKHQLQVRVEKILVLSTDPHSDES